MDKTTTPFYNSKSVHTTKPICKKASQTKNVKKKNRKKKSVKIIHTCCIVNLENNEVKEIDFKQNWVNVTNINKKYLEEKLEVNGFMTNQMALETLSNSKIKQEGSTDVKVEENMHEMYKMWEQMDENYNYYKDYMEKMRYYPYIAMDDPLNYEVKK